MEFFKELNRIGGGMLYLDLQKIFDYVPPKGLVNNAEPARLRGCTSFLIHGLSSKEQSAKARNNSSD